MKNLTVYQLRRRNVEFMKDIVVKNDNGPLQCVHCAIDPNYLSMYILFDNRIYVISMEDNSDITNINFDAYENSKVIGFEYCVTMQELYCAYECGAIARLDIADRVDFVQEIIITFSSGLECMKLSPDNEIITAVTCTGTVITMVSDFQVISEVIYYISLKINIILYIYKLYIYDNLYV